MRKKFGLALGAGGSRGVAHIGFLQAIGEIGLVPDYVTGCSMGAVVGACFCSGVSPERMKEEALKLTLSSIAAFNLSPLRKSGLLKTTKIRRILAGLIGEKDFSELEIPFACVATDLSDGKLAVLCEGNVVDAALASSAIPGVFPPVEFGGHKMLIDGGICERVPAAQVKKMGAECIVAVDVLGDLAGQKAPTGRLLNTVLRTIDLMDTRIALGVRRARRYIDFTLEPELGDMDQYAVKKLGFAYEKGYELGVARREEIARALGV